MIDNPTSAVEKYYIYFVLIIMLKVPSDGTILWLKNELCTTNNENARA